MTATAPYGLPLRPVRHPESNSIYMNMKTIKNALARKSRRFEEIIYVFMLRAMWNISGNLNSESRIQTNYFLVENDCKLMIKI